MVTLGSGDLGKWWRILGKWGDWGKSWLWDIVTAVRMLHGTCVGKDAGARNIVFFVYIKWLGPAMEGASFVRPVRAVHFDVRLVHTECLESAVADRSATAAWMLPCSVAMCVDIRYTCGFATWRHRSHCNGCIKVPHCCGCARRSMIVSLLEWVHQGGGDDFSADVSQFWRSSVQNSF